MSTIICATDTTGAVCFEKIAKEHNRQAIPLIDKQNTQSQEDSICWRKESPISAKTAIIKAEKKYKRIDEVLYYFNEESLCKAMKSVNAHDCLKILEEECAGFQFLVLELLSRFSEQKREDRAKLIFLIRKNFSLIELLQNSMDLSLGSAPHVSAAAASFMAFAENIATFYEGKGIADFYLVHTDCADENFKSDEELAKWLFQYLDESDAKRKSGVQWIKAGSRASRFSLFGR